MSHNLSHLKRHFWWQTMDADTRSFVQACTVCARAKSSHQPPAGLLHPLPIPGRPRSPIGLTIVTSLPSSNVHTVLLNVLDSFPKAVHIIALPKLPIASETPKLGFLLTVDRGSQFILQVWKAFCWALGASVSLLSGYHPQTNGQAERANQDLGTALCCVVARNLWSWNHAKTPHTHAKRVLLTHNDSHIRSVWFANTN